MIAIQRQATAAEETIVGVAVVIAQPKDDSYSETSYDSEEESLRLRAS